MCAFKVTGVLAAVTLDCPKKTLVEIASEGAIGVMYLFPHLKPSALYAKVFHICI